jgi:hypothetical protein
VPRLRLSFRAAFLRRATVANVPLPPSPRTLHRRRRDAYGNLDRKSQIALVGWTAFTATFAGVRALTWAIRNDVGPFRNVSLGGAHIHHYMWGILLLGVSGGAALSIPPTEDSTTTLATVYGVGAALVVDEFALLLDLEDVYWAKQGRISVDIGVGVISVLGSYLAAIPFWRYLATPGRDLNPFD